MYSITEWIRSKGEWNGSGIRNALQKAVLAEHNPISMIRDVKVLYTKALLVFLYPLRSTNANHGALCNVKLHNTMDWILICTWHGMRLLSTR